MADPLKFALKFQDFNMKNKKEALLKKISACFSYRDVLDVETLFVNDQIRSEFKEIEERLPLRIEVSDLKFNGDLIISLTNISYMFFLPSFLSMLITDYTELDVAGDAIIDVLTPKIDYPNSLRQSWKKKYRDNLTYDQCVCIREVLVFLQQEYSCMASEEALNAFWLKFEDYTE